VSNLFASNLFVNYSVSSKQDTLFKGEGIQAKKIAQGKNNIQLPLIPNASNKRSVLLVKIPPICVMGLERRVTTSCNSYLASVDFSCAIQDHVFNTLGRSIKPNDLFNNVFTLLLSTGENIWPHTI